MPPEIRVEVREIRANGIIVAFVDRQRLGLIRWRELSWDRRLSASPTIPELGEQLTAVVLHDRADAAFAELSVRSWVDPWQDFAQKYTVGQVVSGEVVNIRNFGVFVQIAPGIDAVIWPRDLPLAQKELGAAILAVGDVVQGVITRVDSELKKIELSLNDWLKQLSIFAPDERNRLQSQTLLRPQGSTAGAVQQAVESALPNFGIDSNTRYYPPMPPPNRVLIVDDNPADAQTVQQILTQTFAFGFDFVQSGQEALDRLRSDERYDLAIIDLWLQHEHGVQVADQLLAINPELVILFASSDPTAERTIQIDGRRFPCVLKKSAEIVEGIEQLLYGYWGRSAAAYVGRGRFMQQLGMAAFSRRSAVEILQQLLQTFQQETHVTQVILLEVDSVNKVVTIQSAYPPLDEQIRLHSVDGLYYSPVRNVVEDQDEFYRAHIEQDRSPQFKNFFPLLAYQVCYGLPITIPDHVTRHALFLLDERHQELDEQILRQVQLTAYLLQVALERAMLLEFMRRFELRYTHGMLLGSLVHELLAKLDGLEGQTQRLTKLLVPPAARAPTSPAEALHKVKIVSDEIINAKNEVAELVHAYSRMAQGKLEAVDVNLVAQKVIRQLKTKAREAQVILQLEQASTLPFAYTITSRLEQVITNLVLNGIQQIEQQAQHMARLAEQQGAQQRLLQTGTVWVKTQFSKDNPAYPIQILVIDTGPGIHRYRQEDIFLLDTSNRRRGHGLGLFISRNLIETMGGRLQLLESIMFVGSAFLVELPPADVSV